MSADFRDVMRGQFDDALGRLAEDPFVTANGDVVTVRVRRRRAVTNAATAGGSLVAIGALVFAVMSAPFGAAFPAASPSACVTSTPAPDPYPVTTVSPDESGLSFAVELPDGGGTLSLTFGAGADGELKVTFPDGSGSTVAPEGDHAYYVFSLPNGAPVVAIVDGKADLQVTIGDVDAKVVPATETSTPKVVHVAAPATVDCGGQSAAAHGSPFQCDFPLTGVVHEDKALEIKDSGYKSMPEAMAFSGQTDFTVTDPVATLGEPLVAFVTVVSHDGTNSSLDVGTDPDADRVDKQLGATGVSIVKVLNGRVVAVADTSSESPAPSPSANPSDATTDAMGFVRDDGLSILILNDSFFAACPGVTSTAGTDLFAVAGSQTWERQQAGEPAHYVWQKLPGAAD